MSQHIHQLDMVQQRVLNAIPSSELLRWDMPMEFHELHKVLEFLSMANVLQ
jgi:hypothetical protein